MNREDSAKVGGWLDHASKMARTVAEHNAEETIAALTSERDNALAALRRRSSQRDQLDARCEELFVQREELRAAISSVRALADEIENGPGVAHLRLLIAQQIRAALDSSGTVEDAPESTEVEFPEPCQPIGCDNGYHLPGCFFEAVDAAPSAQLPEERSDEPKGCQETHRCPVPDDPCRPGQRCWEGSAEDRAWPAPERGDEGQKKRPACDCGHEFEPDPTQFHLGQCAYRRSFEQPVKPCTFLELGGCHGSCEGRDCQASEPRPSVSGLPVDGDTT